MNFGKTFRSIALLLFLCNLPLICFSGCKEEPINNSLEESFYLLDLTAPISCQGAKVLSAYESVSMGGNDYFGSIILGNTNATNENCSVSFSLKELNKTALSTDIKNISFSIGSTHYEKAYHENYEVVCVYLDDVMIIEDIVYNHDIPSNYSFSVENAETISFVTESENIIIAIGELKVWIGDVNFDSEHESVEDIQTVKLIEDIKPYYVSVEENMFLASSETYQKIQLFGQTYTDCVEVYLPQIEKWNMESFAFFNMEEKYNYLSFSVGGEFLDDSKEAEGIIARISVYADDERVFTEEIVSETLHSFRVPIEMCGKLCIIVESIPYSPPARIGIVSIYAEP